VPAVSSFQPGVHGQRSRPPSKEDSMIVVKRVYEPPHSGDGTRFLVERL
jgi:hypothetical protein